jgi:hypothetical protein
MRPAPHPDFGVQFQNPAGRLMFILLLNRVVCQYAPGEVCRMYDMLLPTAQNLAGYGKQGLKDQLKREYGMDIDKLLVEGHAEEHRKKEGKTKEQNQKEVDDKYQQLLNKPKDLDM